MENDEGLLTKGIYLPLTDTPVVGNFKPETFGLDESYLQSGEISKIKNLLSELLSEFEDNNTDPNLIKMMDFSELKNIDELIYGMICKIRDNKNKLRLQMKAKLLFENEAVDFNFTEEELLSILELGEVDLQKITIDKIIKYYPNLILDNIDKIKEYKNAKKEENRGSSNSSTESES